MESLTQPMAWLAKPDGSVVLGHGPFQATATAPLANPAFYIQDFAMADPLPWKIPASVEHLSHEEFTARCQPLPNSEPIWHPLDAAPFSIVFQEVMSAIQCGIFEKTVPVVTESGTISRNPAAAITAAMARCRPPLRSYGWIEERRGFAGATPELLFSLRGSRLETMALAGTARSEDLDVFAVDEKEIREHEYVAQTLVSKLMDLGPLERQARQILDLGPIIHFLTRILVTLDEPMSPDILIRRLHPTPAVGPLPRTNATTGKLLEWRRRLACPEHFGAPFGLLDHEGFDVVVAIRGVWWQDSQVRIPAGCGIIEASRLVNEWRELRLKREAVKKSITIPEQ